MKRFNKIISMILSIVMIISLISIENLNTTKAAETAVYYVTAPAHNSTVAAGYIDITWNPATAAEVAYYDVYIDGKKVGRTTNTTYEIYTTTVKYYDVYVMATFTNGAAQITATNTFGVSKKGLGLATDMGKFIDLYSMGVSWYYNWGSGPSAGIQYEGIEYVPMVWKETNASNFKTRVERAKNQGYKYMLTFNEPDLRGQCEMSVNDVYNVWQGIEGVNGIKISSPVTAGWPEASTNWFQPFMNKLNSSDYDPDFISIHCYPDNFGGAKMAEWFVETVVDWTWEKYHKPIWITEFSTSGQYVTATGGNGTKEFWETVMPLLDKRTYVVRYAAFGFNAANVGDKKNGPNVALWNYSTGELTEAGQVFVDLGNPTSKNNPTNLIGPTYGFDGKEYENSNKDNDDIKDDDTVKVKKPARAKIRSLKNIKKRKVVVKLNRTKRAKGYQIRWSKNKNFKGYKQKIVRSTKYTIKGLNKKSTCYVKVRAYVQNGKNKVYGSWSKRKSVKIRK